MKFHRLFLVLLTLILFLLLSFPAAASGPTVLVLTLDTVIAPAAREYLRRGIQTAEQIGAEALIVQLDTPGGDLGTMQKMVTDIRSSPVPVVVYVSPRGAWAGSAGTIITLAGHVAAMAPETAIGAASPVGEGGQELGETMKAKAEQIIRATVRSLAERRGADAVALAEDTIENARAVSSAEALKAGLIDFIANDLDDLLRQMDGFTVQMADGPRTLQTEGAAVQTLGMSFIEQLLDILTNPNIVLILMSIGAQAIIIELSSPGGWVAGFIGVICLLLGAYGLGFLSVNWFGLIFLVIAFVLFIADIKAATHGGLTAAGIGSFIIGALILFNSPGTPAVQRVSIPLVVVLAVVMGGTFAIVVGFALKAQKVPVRTGQESLAGGTGIAVTEIAPRGQVQAAGELWTAEVVEGSPRIRKGDRVEIVKVEGVRLKVRKKQ